MNVNAACLLNGEDVGRGPGTGEGSPLGCFSSWKMTISCGLLRFSARTEISRPLSRFALKMASFSRSVQNTLSCGVQIQRMGGLEPKPMTSV